MVGEGQISFSGNQPDQLKNKPKVYVNGKLKELKNSGKIKNLSNTTLRVYKFLLSHPGFHGVRDLQRELDYSSPGSIIYHTKKLLDSKLIEKSEDGKYCGVKEIKKGEAILKYVNILIKTVPNLTYFSISIFSISVILILITISLNLPIFIMGPVILTLSSISILLVKYGMNLSKILVDLSTFGSDGLKD